MINESLHISPVKLPYKLSCDVHLFPSSWIRALSPNHVLKVVLLLEHVSNYLATIGLPELVGFAAVLVVHLDLVVLVKVIIEVAF